MTSAKRTAAATGLFGVYLTALWFAFAMALPAPAAAACVGDCDLSGDVAVNELITMVNIALGSAVLSACPPGDADDSGDIAINEIIQAVGYALGVCPEEKQQPDTHTVADRIGDDTAHRERDADGRTNTAADGNRQPDAQPYSQRVSHADPQHHAHQRADIDAARHPDGDGIPESGVRQWRAE